MIVLIFCVSCAPTSTIGVSPTATTQAGLVTSTMTSTSPSIPPALSVPSPTERPQAEQAESCDHDICVLDGHFIMRNPISAFGNRFSDDSYRYGSTQGGLRETHHGVEFANNLGIPVLAVADGEVVFAESDAQIKIGWVPNFYGNVVVIRHRADGFDQDLYSLYAHLSTISVKRGDMVEVGKMVGTVGATGTARGSHLHFEVRSGSNDSESNQNPLLWVVPEPEMGVIAGRLINSIGEEVEGTFNVQAVSDGVVNPSPTTSITTYENKKLPVGNDPNWRENFAAGNLRQGEYRVSLVYNNKVYEKLVNVQDGKLTFVVFVVK